MGAITPNQDPKITPATPEQLDTLDQLAELTLRNISGVHQAKGLRQRYLPIPSQADERIVIAKYRPAMLEVEHEDGGSINQDRSRVVINTLTHSIHYYGTGKFSGPVSSPDHQVFTSEAAQRMTDEIVEAANLSPLTDNIAK